MNESETASQRGESKGQDQGQILKVRVRESPFVLLTNIYRVPTYMSDTVLGPDDIVVTKTKCLLR